MTDRKNKPIITKVDGKIIDQLKQDFKGIRSDCVQVGPQNWFFTAKYEEVAEEYLNFEVRPDDTWIVTFPRSGTTLTQELVWLVSNNVDLNAAKATRLFSRSPYLDIALGGEDEVMKEIIRDNADSRTLLGDRNVVHMLRNMPSPRFIKSHLPISLLPKNLLSSGAKVVYVARNPKNVAVSWYYFSRLMRFTEFVGDFITFWDYFEKDLTKYSPYWAHVIEAWNHRNEPNLLFIFYEEYTKSPEEYIAKIAKFLNKPLSKDQLEKVVNHLKIDNFRKNPSVSAEFLNELKFNKPNEQPHIRKGKTGDWEEEFTPELLERADKWIEKHLKDTDLRFPL